MEVIFYYFISVYALVKNILGISKGAIGRKHFLVGLVLQICLFTLTIAVLLSSFLLLMPFQLFLWGLDLYLVLKLGKNYGGRLKAQDAIYDSPEEKISISVILILNHNDDEEVVLNKMKRIFEKVHRGFYKLSCTVEKCTGYAYYVNNQVTADETCIFTKVNDGKYLTREAFLEYIQKKHMIKIINNKRLWYARIFTQPILWNKKSETNKQIAILLVFRHCLADGVSLIGVLKNFMIREENPEFMKLDPKYTTKPNFSFDDVYIYRNPLTAKFDDNLFDIRHAERQVAFYVEDEIKYVPMVKKLKTKLGVGFTEILIGGLTASLAQLLSKRGKSLDKCSAGVIYRPINEDLVSIINGTYDYDKLTNDSTLIVIYLPVTMKKGSTMRDRINKISAELEKAKHSIDSLTYYVTGNIAHLLPVPILRLCVEYITFCTAGASNVGGLKTGTIAGYEVETAMSFISYFLKTDFRLSIISRDDRFQLALTTRENLLENRNEAQLVLNNTFKFIDQLNEEIENEP